MEFVNSKKKKEKKKKKNEKYKIKKKKKNKQKKPKKTLAFSALQNFTKVYASEIGTESYYLQGNTQVTKL